MRVRRLPVLAALLLLAACAGTIATPANIVAHTTNLPWEVTGDISPKPTVVSVVNPKYSAVK